MSIEAMKQALDAIELARSTHDVMLLSDPPQQAWKYHGVDWKLLSAVQHLRLAIAEAEKQEPVAWMYEYWDDHHDASTGGQWRKNMTQLPLDLSNCRNVQPLYTHPQPKREWVGLTDKDLQEMKVCGSISYKWVKAAEAKLKEKNT